MKKNIETKKGISRRDFVQKSGTAVIGAAFLPTILPACARWSGANDRINIAHIGAGNRAQGLMKNSLLLSDECQIVAVCDPFTDRRDKAAENINKYYAKLKGLEQYNGCKAYNDFREVLQRDDLDAVIIATPDHWHVLIAIAAAKAGKDIYLEKPLGLTIEQGQKLRNVVHEHKVIFQYGTQQRSGSQFRLACELTRNKVIGDLKSVDAWCPGRRSTAGKYKPEVIPDGFDYNLWQGPAQERPFTSDRVSYLGAWFIYDYAIGFIAGWGAHSLDIAQWGNDSDDSSPVKYSGKGAYFDKENLFDTINAWDIQAEYANGVKMNFFSQEDAKTRIESYREKYANHGTTFWGTDGWISVDRGGIYASDPAILNYQLKSNDIRLYKSNNHQANFLDCIHSRNETICTIDAAVRSDTISHLGDILIATSASEINWDPETETILNPTEEIKKMLHREMRTPWKI